MNPLLLKPEKDTQSQVILMGQVNAELSRMEWRGRSASVWPVVALALDELLAENDLVVMEGAGSPARSISRPAISSTCVWRCTRMRRACW